MKIRELIYRISILTIFPTLVFNCSEDEGPTPISTDFAGISSSYSESSGTGNLMIPFRNATAAFVNDPGLVIGGTATEGSDFTVVGITDEGIQLSIIDDDVLEENETIRLQIASNGNSVHTVTIVSNCQDKGGLQASSFAGSWAALEDYGSSGTFGPYNVTFVQDATNANKFTFTNFYGSGSQYIAYVILDVPNGTIKFPDQTVGAPTYNHGPITLSSGTFNLCTEKRTLDITLFYDGLQWDYHFTKN